ncbi:MAG: hypothetical protein ABWY78_07810 [Microvirga sp.]
MAQTPASLDQTLKQRLVFAAESALIILMFHALAVVLFATRLRSRRSNRRREHQTAQAWG